jgi:hypothetical protein
LLVLAAIAFTGDIGFSSFIGVRFIGSVLLMDNGDLKTQTKLFKSNQLTQLVITTKLVKNNVNLKTNYYFNQTFYFFFFLAGNYTYFFEGEILVNLLSPSLLLLVERTLLRLGLFDMFTPFSTFFTGESSASELLLGRKKRNLLNWYYEIRIF